ncbi:MAG TPA: hypothetical protein VGQ72_04785 [Pyrinomonadaceae bacterium]|jgi:hypothetical protein|nr:hypothetical protein [Pyrinomonadaceae bacterium]
MSDFLFASSSWLSGAARTLDLAATFDDYNMSLNPAQADWLALNADALATYKDLWSAFAKSAKDAESAESESAQK